MTALDMPAFTARALCAETDPEAFFPEQGQPVSAAKRVCAACQARPECLDYALSRNVRVGVWGGLSARERRELRNAPDVPAPTVDDLGAAVQRLRGRGMTFGEMATALDTPIGQIRDALNRAS